MSAGRNITSFSLRQLAEMVPPILSRAFIWLHLGVEAELRGQTAVYDERSPLALAAEERVNGVIKDALAQAGAMEGPQDEIATRVDMVVGRALAEDFLARVDPVLHPDEDGDKGESDVDR